jgi:2'-5' RNA ligase
VEGYSGETTDLGRRNHRPRSERLENRLGPYLPERRYNATAIMASSRYALVGYVRNSIGEFIERVRRELHPGLPLLAAHLTILPPRILCGSEGDALESLHDICSRAEPFEVTLGEVETFIPVTPTVFIRVGHGASRMQELHDQLNREVFFCTEEWPYIPHLTIVKMSTEEQAWEAFEVARRRWQRYSGTRRILVEELTFVREDERSGWMDLATVRLGSRLVMRQSP